MMLTGLLNRAARYLEAAASLVYEGALPEDSTPPTPTSWLPPSGKTPPACANYAGERTTASTVSACRSALGPRHPGS